MAYASVSNTVRRVITRRKEISVNSITAVTVIHLTINMLLQRNDCLLFAGHDNLLPTCMQNEFKWEIINMLLHM
jgi:hypothetical protein